MLMMRPPPITLIAQFSSNHLPGLLIDLHVIICHTIGIVNLQLEIKCESDCISYYFRLPLRARSLLRRTEYRSM
jgi:hypothetical protein